MVVAQLRHLRQILVSEQQLMNLRVGLLQKMALKYSILQVSLIHLLKGIKHYILYELVAYQNLLTPVLKSLQLMNVLDQTISYQALVLKKVLQLQIISQAKVQAKTLFLILLYMQYGNEFIIMCISLVTQLKHMIQQLLLGQMFMQLYHQAILSNSQVMDMLQSLLRHQGHIQQNLSQQMAVHRLIKTTVL